MMPTIICHRGVDRKDENSLKSIKSIRKQNIPGYQLGVEFDIQITDEERLICFHDQTLSSGKNVSECSIATLRKHGICELIDIIDGVEKHNSNKKIINIELKSHPNHERNQLLKMCKMVHQIVRNLQTINHYIITSSDLYIISHLRYLNSLYHIDLGLIIDDEKFLPLIKQNLTDYVIVYKKFVTQLPKYMTAQYKGCFFYTIYSIEDDNESEDEVINLYLEQTSMFGLITDDLQKVVGLKEV